MRAADGVPVTAVGRRETEKTPKPIERDREREFSRMKSDTRSNISQTYRPLYPLGSLPVRLRYHALP